MSTRPTSARVCGVAGLGAGGLLGSMAAARRAPERLDSSPVPTLYLYLCARLAPRTARNMDLDEDARVAIERLVIGDEAGKAPIRGEPRVERGWFNPVESSARNAQSQDDDDDNDDDDGKEATPMANLSETIASVLAKGARVTIESLCTLATLFTTACKRDSVDAVIEHTRSLCTLLQGTRGVLGATATECMSCDELTDVGFDEVVSSVHSAIVTHALARFADTAELVQASELLRGLLERERALKQQRAAVLERAKTLCSNALREGVHPSDDAVSAELDALLDPLLPDAAERAAKEAVLEALARVVKERFPDAELQIFGSSANMLGFKSSDMDVCMQFATATPKYVFRNLATVENTGGGTAEEFMKSLQSN